jgi:hypothetical protein
MLHLSRLLPLSLLLLSAGSAHAELEWNGSVHTRYLAFNYDDGLSSRDAQGKDLSLQKLRAWQYRGNIFGKSTWENWAFFAGLRLSNTQVNDYNAFNQGQNGAVKLEYAAGQYTWRADELSLAVTAGRQGTPFHYDKLAQHAFDNDVRWDGFNEELKWGNLGLIASQFAWGAKSQGVMGASTYTKTEASEATAAAQSGFAMLYAFEPYATFRLGDGISTTLAVAYYDWSNAENLNNTLHGGYVSKTLNPNADTGTVSVSNAKVWHAYNNWSFPYNLHAVGEWTANKKTFYTGTNVEADNKSYTVGVGYGTIKNAGDFAFDYFYVSKGLASMPGVIDNGGVKPDNKGHLFYLRYSPWTKVSASVVAYFLEEKAGLDAAGTPSLVHQKQTQWYFVVGTGF